MGPMGRETTRQTARRSTTDTRSENQGFVITISGYSPYGDIGELLDPAGVQDDPSRWGFVTRLMDTNSISEGTNKFEIYKKTAKEHFEIKTGEVGTEAEMPLGIGVRRAVTGADSQTAVELIDPMTKEVISKEALQGENNRRTAGNIQYKINDHWFVLNLKLRWQDSTAAPGGPEEMPPGADGRPEAASRRRGMH
jgi:hypothetical protein